MASQEMSRERIWKFSTRSRWGWFGTFLPIAAPTRLSSRRSPIARPISVTSAARVRRATVSTTSLAPVPPISVRFSVPVSSVFPSVWRLWHVSPSVRGFLIMPVLWRLPTLSPAVMFINPVLDDFWTTIWFQPQSRIRTLHCSWPTSWFFRPALGLKGWNRGSQTGVELAISSARLLEVDAHHERRAAGTVTSCGGLLWGQFASIAPSCWSTAWGTCGATRSPCAWLLGERVLFSFLQRLVCKDRNQDKWRFP